MTTAENKTGGRVPGSRNKRTLALLNLAEEGETPCAFALRIMRDAERPDDIRMHAARLAAPYIHPKPQPESRYVALELSGDLSDAESLKKIHVTLLQSIAAGETSLEEARELSGILDNYRRCIELSDIEPRLKVLEEKSK